MIPNCPVNVRKLWSLSQWCLFLFFSFTPHVLFCSISQNKPDIVPIIFIVMVSFGSLFNYLLDMTRIIYISKRHRYTLVVTCHLINAIYMYVFMYLFGPQIHGTYSKMPKYQKAFWIKRTTLYNFQFIWSLVSPSLQVSSILLHVWFSVCGCHHPGHHLLRSYYPPLLFPFMCRGKTENVKRWLTLVLLICDHPPRNWCKVAPGSFSVYVISRKHMS